MSMFNNGANDRWEIGDAIELDLDELLGRGPDDEAASVEAASADADPADNSAESHPAD